MLTLTATQSTSFVSAVCTALQAAHASGWASTITTPTRQIEPRMVAHLCAGMVGVATALRPLVTASHPGVQLDLTTVFTHQTPQVSWPPAATTPTRCELADLLLAVIDRRAGSPSFGKGRATLLQAKLSDTYTVKLSGGDKDQFDLLAKRATFDVVGTSTPKRVDLRGAHPDQSLMYLLMPPDAITPPPTAGHLWKSEDHLSTCTPYTVTATKCLAEMLVELLQGLTGDWFDLPPPGMTWTHFAPRLSPGQDDWSYLINYLLEVTFRAPLIQLPTKPTRGADHHLYLRGSSPQGNPMFFIFDGDPSAPVDLEMAKARAPKGFRPLNGDGGDGPREISVGIDDQVPISAIVFELRASNEE